MQYLFLDDIRVPADITWIDIVPDNSYCKNSNIPWAIVRSYDQAVRWVLDNGFPNVASLDHDLGYEEYNTNENGIIIVTNATDSKSGYDFAKWIIEYDMDTNSMPDNFTFTVHSMNPVGKARIENILNSYLEYKFSNS